MRSSSGHDWYQNEMISRERWNQLLSSVQTIILVDSVINRGESIRRCIHTLQELRPVLPRVFVLTGVMQSKASIALPQEFHRVQFLALRVSENQYTGKGGTDTGNRLFGTF